MSIVIQYPSGMSNGFFVKGSSGIIAVDGGALYGAEHARKACSDAGINPADIRLIVASHAHVDHTCNLDELRRLSGAPIAVNAAGREDMENAVRPDVHARNRIGDEIMAFVAAQGDNMPEDYLPEIIPDIVWEEEFPLNDYGIEGKLIYTPGHSLSDCCLILDDGQAIIGDLVCEDGFTHGKPTLAYFGYTEDRNKANEMLFPSIEKLLAYDVTICYAGHGGPFTREQVCKAFAEAKAEAAE